MEFYPQVSESDFSTITEDDGLSNNGVNYILQDRLGFVWFATTNGLCKYNGRKFTTYRVDKSINWSLPSNEILTILEAHDGSLWVGTMKGLCRFDRDKIRFAVYNFKDTTSLNSDKISTLFEDEKGILWIGTRENGLYKLNTLSGEFRSFKHNVKNQNSICSNYIRDILKDNKGNLWLACWDGLCVFDPNAETFTTIVIKGSKSLNNFASLYMDNGGYIWIGKAGDGLYRYSPKNKIFDKIPLEKNATTNSPLFTITGIVEDKNENLWLSSYSGNGLIRLNKRTYVQHSYNFGKSHIENVHYTTVSNVYIDDDEVLWAATFFGIKKYDLKKKPISFHSFYEQTIHPDSQNYISKTTFAFSENNDGTIYAATRFGLKLLDRNKRLIKSYYHQSNNQNSILKGEVNSLFKDKHGEIWIGGYGGGVNVFDDGASYFKEYKSEPNNPNSLWSNFVVGFLKNKNGEVWVVTSGGLNKYNRQLDNFEKVFIDENDSMKIKNSINSFVEDDNGNIWFGLWDGGILVFNEESKKVSRITSSANASSSLCSDNILAISKDKKGNIWIGTTEGLNVYNIDSKKFFNYSVKDGISGNEIYGITEDDIGNIWIGTNHGITRFNIKSKTFTNFGKNQERLSAYIFSGIKLMSGEILFTSDNGFFSFFPQELEKEEENLSPLVITSLTVNNKEYFLEKDVSKIDEITLPPSVESFSLDFALLNYAGPSSHRFAYLMEGLDKDWIYTGNVSSVFFSHLHPGEYTFQIKAQNENGSWSKNIKRVKLILTPPFYKTNWFYFLAFSFLVTLLYLSFQHRVKLYKKREDKLERTVEERTSDLIKAKEELTLSLENEKQLSELRSRFVSITSHEFKTPLTSIYTAAEIIEKFDDKLSTEEKIENIKLIQKNVQHMNKILNNILVIGKHETKKLKLNLEEINLGTICSELVTNVTNLVNKGSKHTIFFESNNISQPVFLDEKFIRQMLENLLSNAVKYSPGRSNIYFSASINENEIIFVVKDEGVGIAEEDMKYLFQPFSRGGNVGNIEGTGLGLVVVKLAADLHNGTIDVHSHNGKGTEFIVRIPMQKKQNE